MKTCTRCGSTKMESEFFVKSKETGRLHSQCKMCYKEHRRTYYIDHYLKYGDHYRARAKIRRVKVQWLLHQNMMEYLFDKACVICGESDSRVLDFDHINPGIKSFSIAKGLTDGLKWEKILAEIEKCQILCSNCHRKRTASERGWYKTE